MRVATGKGFPKYLGEDGKLVWPHPGRKAEPLESRVIDTAKATAINLTRDEFIACALATRPETGQRMEVGTTVAEHLTGSTVRLWLKSKTGGHYERFIIEIPDKFDVIGFKEGD